MPKTAISWKLNPDLLVDLKKIAQADNRPLNNLVETVLIDFVKKTKERKSKK